jgi:hypothetical protein
MSRERSAGGLSTMRTPRNARESGRKTGASNAKCSARWVPKAPSLGQVLACRADPGVDQWVPNCLRDRIEAPLLCRLVRMVEVELIHELVERHREIGGLCAGDLGDFG